jgi:cytosine/adenosine deaminase-related metal-dependent hydrolase
VVVVQDDGTERRVIALDSLPRARDAFPAALEEDAGFALSPAPVNAHTHLDLSSMPYSPGRYGDFIRAVIDHGRSGARGLEAARQGAEQILAQGVEVIGDVVTDEDVMRWLLRHPRLRGVAYWEVLGPDPEQADALFERARRQVQRFRALERPGGMRVGVSPHTPHTVSAALLRRLSGWAHRERVPVAIHVAESPAETALHRRGEGPLAAFLGSLGVPWRASGDSPVGYLEALGVLRTAPTLIHMVEVDEEDVRCVQRAGATVVHCPRSNEALGCRIFPWELYARHGVDVGFGTDSRGSSPDLEVAAEVAAARRLHGGRAAPQALVRAAVKGGYRALGMRTPRVVRGDPAAALWRWPVYTA